MKIEKSKITAGEASRRGLLAALLCMVTPFAVTAQQNGRETAPDTSLQEKVFEESYPVLTDTLELIDRHEALPKRALFKTDQKANQKKIDKLLREAIGLLQLSEEVNIRDETQHLREQIATMRQQNAEYRRARVAAPDKALAGLNEVPFRVTKAGYDAKIAENDERIEAAEKEIAGLQQKLVETLNARGIQISETQAETLLSSVDGRDYLNLTAVFENVKWLTDQYQRLTAESNEDIETARQYYGLYLVLLNIVDTAQRDLVARINEEYLPRLQELEKDAEAIIDSAKKALKNRDLSPQNRAAENANVEAAGITLQVIAQYRLNLERQAQAVERRNRKISQSLSTAENTYRTVVLSKKLVEMMRDNVRGFQAVMAMEPPPIMTFRNQAMRTEFQNLSTLLSDL